ncbi:hypothetical protein MRB53_037706 [Persea americana]|nr:hypothetical protein MRB53_037706 [Persea americana]
MKLSDGGDLGAIGFTKKNDSILITVSEKKLRGWKWKNGVKLYSRNIKTRWVARSQQGHTAFLEADFSITILYESTNEVIWRTTHVERALCCVWNADGSQLAIPHDYCIAMYQHRDRNSFNIKASHYLWRSLRPNYQYYFGADGFKYGWYILGIWFLGNDPVTLLQFGPKLLAVYDSSVDKCWRVDIGRATLLREHLVVGVLERVIVSLSDKEYLLINLRQIIVKCRLEPDENELIKSNEAKGPTAAGATNIMSSKSELAEQALNSPLIKTKHGNKIDFEEAEYLQTLDRSPHPYQLNFQGKSKNERLNKQREQVTEQGRSSPRKYNSSARASSESGTEADDETERRDFVKALPAPALRPRKGLKAGEKDEDALLTPSQLDDEGRRLEVEGGSKQQESYSEVEEQQVLLKRRLNEFARRSSEIALIGVIMVLVCIGRGVWLVVNYWSSELVSHLAIMVGLVLAYPVKLSMVDTRTTINKPWQRFRVPASFDPATVLYPPLLPVLVALSISPVNRAIVLPNIILGLASLPQRLFPRSSRLGGYNTVHWVVSTLPLILGMSLKWLRSIESTD